MTGSSATSPSPVREPRVLLTIRHFYPDGGGAEVSALSLARGLVERGVPATVLTGRYGRRPRREETAGVRIRRHFIGAYVPVVHELCYLASLAWELMMRRRTYDIIHVYQTQLSACVALLVARGLGKRVIISNRCAGTHGDMAFWSSIPGGKQLLGLLASGVDAAVGVSRDVVRELLEAGFDVRRTWYIPNGVALPAPEDRDRLRSRQKLGFDSNDFIVLFVGRLSAQKAPGLLLDAWPGLVHLQGSGKLVLVGDGNLRSRLETRTRRLGLGDSVRFAGKVDNVQDYLSAADVFVLPSLSEGMSNALLEAMACSLPVVASNISGTVDLVRDRENGLLFESGHREQLLDCLVFLAASSERRAMLGAAARRTVEAHFSIDATTDNFVELYRSLGPGRAAGTDRGLPDRRG